MTPAAVPGVPAAAAPAPVTSYPVLAGHTGSLFVDSVDPAARWYLPALALAPDADAAFAFAVAQTSQQADGRPFDTVQVTFGVTSTMAADASAFAHANPAVSLKPIPLAGLTATLASVYTDATGAQKQHVFTGASVAGGGSGDLVLSFGGDIIGDAIATLYQDLRVFGRTTIVLAGTYTAWVQRYIPGPPSPPPTPPVPPHPVPGPHPLPRAVLPQMPLALPPRPGRWVSLPMPQTWSQSLAVGAKYALDAYQLRFTITPPQGATRIITDLGDLATLGAVAVGLVPFKALGDISSAYPTLAAAYVDVLGRTLILVPHSYAIIRRKSGCAAQCYARLDMASGSAGGCRYEFDFTVAPHVSPIELRHLSDQLAAHPDIKDYALAFPAGLSDTRPSTLQTAFKSSAAFGPGTDPHSFAVTLVVEDDGPSKPAIADANLLMMQICSGTGAAPVGVLNVRLDTGDTVPAPCALVLGFAVTTGTDDLAATFDAAAKIATLTNQSPFDLTLLRTVIATVAGVTDGPVNQTLAAGTSLALPITGDATGAAGASVLADAQLAVTLPPAPETLAKLLNLTSVDVQNTQFLIAVDASSVDFARVQSIGVTVTIAALPTVVPPAMSLSRDNLADTIHILVPVEDAVFSLAASLQLAATFTPGNGAPRSGTASNDFVRQPVFVLTQAMIDGLPPA